jgi:hypothetical protein
MRFLVIAVATTFLLAPVSTPASARSGVSLKSVQSVDLSAKAKKKQEKVEYMRSAAGPEPTIKKPKKQQKTAKKAQ